MKEATLKTALITGITGQDGSYLAELLLEKGYQVVGLDHPQSTITYEMIEPIRPRITLVEGDLIDQESLDDIIATYLPDEVYNLAAISFPPISWNKPLLTGEITALGVTRLLESIRRIVPNAHFYQASSSEMFGIARQSPQNEDTPFWPRNPYGVSKVFGHWITVNYREYHKLFAVSGILFNHESPRRGLEYVTRKITRGVAEIKMGLAENLTLGNLDARRDWGFAGDYVRAMWMMLQQEEAQDYVVGTGLTHSVRELCEFAFGYVGMDYNKYVVQDPALYRPPEKVQLVANPHKANNMLGWKPAVNFERLVHMMVEADLQRIQKGEK